MTTRLPWALAASLVLGTAIPATAAAQQTDPTAFWSLTIGLGTPVLAVDAILVAEAIDKGLRGHGLHQPGAIFEIAWGGVHLVGALIAIGGSTLAYDPVPLALTFAVPLTLVGGYLVAHGIWSLVPQSSWQPKVQVAIAPDRDGAQLVAFGTF